MENQDTNAIRLVSDRSLDMTLRVGLRVMTRNIWTLLRGSWIALLLTILCPPLYIVFAAQLDALFRKWGELNFIPRRKAWRVPVNRLARVATMFAVALLCVALVAGLVVCLMLSDVEVWLCITLGFLLALMLLPIDVVLLYLSYSDQPVGKCFAKITSSLKHYLTLLGFHFFVTLAALSIVALVALPLVQLTLVYCEYRHSLAMGDDVSLPGSFCYLVAATYVAGMYVTLRVATAYKCMRATLWGSLEGTSCN